MLDISTAVLQLERWVERLERHYVEVAARASERDLESEAEALERDGILLDHIEAHRNRARHAIELGRKLEDR